VNFVLTNTSEVDGVEVDQVYVEFPDTSWNSHPKQELKAFQKVLVSAGMSVQVEIELTEEVDVYYNTALKNGRWKKAYTELKWEVHPEILQYV